MKCIQSTSGNRTGRSSSFHTANSPGAAGGKSNLEPREEPVRYGKENAQKANSSSAIDQLLPGWTTI
jgi:hypothetical protein